jgi:hypothetical protein
MPTYCSTVCGVPEREAICMKAKFAKNSTMPSSCCEISAAVVYEVAFLKKNVNMYAHAEAHGPKSRKSSADTPELEPFHPAICSTCTKSTKNTHATRKKPQSKRKFAAQYAESRTPPTSCWRFTPFSISCTT